MNNSEDKAKTPKYMQVKETIREWINTGAVNPGDRLPPDTVLPQQLGFSKPTVLRALNDLVDEGMLVRRRGSGTYVSEPRIQPLLPKRDLRIGIVTSQRVIPSWFSERYTGRIVQSILEVLGIASEVPFFPLIDSRGDTRAVWHQPERRLAIECLGIPAYGALRHPSLESVRAGNFSGLLAVGIDEEEWLDKLLEIDIPVVLIDVMCEKYIRKADQVYVDPFFGYRAATNYFITNGLQNIHFIGQLMTGSIPDSALKPDMKREDWQRLRIQYQRRNPDSYLRLSAFRQAMEEKGEALPEQWIHFASNAHKYMLQLGEKLINLSEEDRPEAVICHNLHTAEQLIEYFAKHGLELEGAGAMGVHNANKGRALPVEVDISELGTIGAELLVTRLQNPGRKYIKVGSNTNFEVPEDRVKSEVNLAQKET